MRVPHQNIALFTNAETAFDYFRETTTDELLASVWPLDGSVYLTIFKKQNKTKNTQLLCLLSG